MLLDVPDSPTQLFRLLRADVFVTHDYRAGVGLDQMIEAAEEGRLSRSAFTDESGGETGRDVEAYVVESDDAPESMRYIPRAERCLHALKCARAVPWCR